MVHHPPWPVGQTTAKHGKRNGRITCSCVTTKSKIHTRCENDDECLPLHTWMLPADTCRHTSPSSQKFHVPERGKKIAVGQNVLRQQQRQQNGTRNRDGKLHHLPIHPRYDSFGTHIAREFMETVHLEFVDKRRRTNRVIPVKDEHGL